MRQISIRNLKAKLSAELKDLPFAVTNNGKIVGYVVTDCHANVVTIKDCSHDNQITPDNCSHDRLKSLSVKKDVVTEIKQKIDKITKIHRQFDMCPKHKVFYKSCGCR